jgi:putative FmdB family regulatory protein
MPTYEYICTSCSHEWENMAKITAPPTATCPKCKKKTAKRLISGGVGFQLKGSGWAREGYSTTSK